MALDEDNGAGPWAGADAAAGPSAGGDTLPDAAPFEITEDRVLVRPYVDEFTNPPPDGAPEELEDEEPTAQLPLPVGGARHLWVPGAAYRQPGRSRSVPVGRHVLRAGAGRARAVLVAGAVAVIVVGAGVLVAGAGGRPGTPGSSAGTRPAQIPGPGGHAGPGGSTDPAAAAAGSTAPAQPGRPSGTLPGSPGTPGPALTVASSGAGTPSVPGGTPGTTPPATPSDPTTTGTPTTAPSPLLPPPSQSVTGVITNVAGFCLSAVTSGADRVRLWDCGDGDGQRWTLASDGTLRTIGLCAEPGSGMVLLLGCDGNPAQQWRVGPAPSLVNLASLSCLGDPLAGTGKGTQESVAPCDQSGPQQWKLPGTG